MGLIVGLLVGLGFRTVDRLLIEPLISANQVSLFEKKDEELYAEVVDIQRKILSKELAHFLGIDEIKKSDIDHLNTILDLIYKHTKTRPLPSHPKKKSSTDKNFRPTTLSLQNASADEINQLKKTIDSLLIEKNNKNLTKIRDFLSSLESLNTISKSDFMQFQNDVDGVNKETGTFFEKIFHQHYKTKTEEKKSDQ